MRVTAVFHYPGLLAQPNTLLRPSLPRGVVRGLGQQEVLSRQNVHDVAFAIDQLDRMFEVTRPFQDKERTIHVNVRNCGSSL